MDDVSSRRIPAHAMLDDWVQCNLDDGAHFVIGIVTGDTKKRFRDGARMHTSLVLTPPQDVAEGAIIETMNTRYLLGRRETDKDAIRNLLAAYARSIIAPGHDQE